MTETTTIKLSQETKTALEAEQLDGETFDQTVARILGESNFESRVRELARQEITDRVVPEAQV